MLNNENEQLIALSPNLKTEFHHLYIHSDGLCTINGQTFAVKKGDTIQINYQPNEI